MCATGSVLTNAQERHYRLNSRSGFINDLDQNLQVRNLGELQNYRDEEADEQSLNIEPTTALLHKKLKQLDRCS
jgi:hypothetical protein